jgi:hypothetical protein
MKKQNDINFKNRHQEQRSAIIRIVVAAVLVTSTAMLFANFPLFTAVQGQQTSIPTTGSVSTGNNSSSNTTINTTTTANAIAGNQSSQAIINNIHSLLTQLISAYKIQNYTGAENAAVEAYLDNFESLEGPIATHDQQLMVQTELLLREQLRQAVQNKAPIEQVQQLVDQINANLDKAAALLMQK